MAVCRKIIALVYARAILSLKTSLGTSWEQNIEGKTCSYDSPSDVFRENLALSYTRAKLLPLFDHKMGPGSFWVVWGSLGSSGETLGRLWGDFGKTLGTFGETLGGFWETLGGLGGFWEDFGRL